AQLSDAIPQTVRPERSPRQPACLLRLRSSAGGVERRPPQFSALPHSMSTRRNWGRRPSTSPGARPVTQVGAVFGAVLRSGRTDFGEAKNAKLELRSPDRESGARLPHTRGGG